MVLRGYGGYAYTIGVGATRNDPALLSARTGTGPIRLQPLGRAAPAWSPQRPVFMREYCRPLFTLPPSSSSEYAAFRRRGPLSTSWTTRRIGRGSGWRKEEGVARLPPLRKSPPRPETPPPSEPASTPRYVLDDEEERARERQGERTDLQPPGNRAQRCDANRARDAAAERAGVGARYVSDGISRAARIACKPRGGPGRPRTRLRARSSGSGHGRARGRSDQRPMSATKSSMRSTARSSGGREPDPFLRTSATGSLPDAPAASTASRSA